MNISLSGLRANETRLAVSADNVANMATTGKVGDASSGYKAKEVQQSSQAGGGVSTKVVETAVPQVAAFSPNDPNADEQGLVSMPNVDLSQETINQMMAVTGYKANAAAIRTLSGMEQALLDIKA